jgi:hypothetical protein
MPSRNAAVAEAVKAQLNAAAATTAAFGRTFTARRVYVPANSLAALKDLCVSVYAAGDEQEPATRARNLHDVTVEVGIQQRLPATCDPEAEAGNAQIDPLTDLAERVADSFRQGPAGDTGAQWAGTKLTLPDVEHLLQDRVFTAVVTLTYKLLA